MKETILKAPKTVDDLRIRHNEVLTDEQFKGDFTIGKACKFVSKMTGVDLPLMYNIDTKDVIKVFHHCIKIFGDYKKEEPKEQITIEGVTYYKVNPKKVASGWHIDLDSLPENPDPVLLMALLYIPEGVYGQLDENKNIKFPIAERRKIFEEHFKLTDFLNSIGFFLNK